MEEEDQSIDKLTEAIVRKNLASLDANAPLDEDEDLQRLGLSSMKAIAVLLDLESELGITIPDQFLVPRHHRSLATLRAMVRSIVGT